MSRGVVNSHGHKCLCALCICGKHRCPKCQKQPSHYPADLKSTAQHHYPGWNGDLRACPKHRNEPLRMSLPFEGGSTTHGDFKDWKDARPADIIRLPQSVAAGGPEDRDFESEARSHFKHTRLPTPTRPNPRSSIPASLPFQGTSTAKSDFSGTRARPATAYRPPASTAYIGDGSAPDFSSEARSHFTDKTALRDPSKSYKRVDSLAKSSPFDGFSTSKSDFPAWKEARPATAFVPKRAANIAPEDRDFTTEARRNFLGKHAKPERAANRTFVLSPSLPFEGVASGRADYPHWAEARPAQGRQLKDNGDILNGDPKEKNFVTEAKRQFAGTFGPKAALATRPNLWSPSKDNRDFETENQARTKQLKGRPQPAKLCKPADHLLENAPFSSDGTTNRNTYQFPTGAQKTQSFKPRQSAMFAPESRLFETEASENFGPKQNPICPSEGVRLVYPKEDNGHVMYKERFPDAGRWTPVPGTPALW